jgi:hypothetical protein
LSLVLSATILRQVCLYRRFEMVIASVFARS